MSAGSRGKKRYRRRKMRKQVKTTVTGNDNWHANRTQLTLAHSRLFQETGESNSGE